MEQAKREKAELLIKKILQEKSFLILTQDEKKFLFDEFSDDMKATSKDYEVYLSLSDSEKLENIVMYALKEYMGSWHVTPSEMEELSEYVQSIAKGK